MKSKFFFVVGSTSFEVSKSKFIEELQTNKYVDEKGDCTIRLFSKYEFASGQLITEYYLNLHS